MTPTPPDSYTALRDAAMAATPGPWFHGDRSFTIRVGTCPVHLYDHPCGTSRPVATVNDPDDGFRAEVGMGSRKADGDFIALANPATILAILNELAAARVAVRSSRSLRNELRSKNYDARLLLPGEYDTMSDAIDAYDRATGAADGKGTV